MHKIAVTLNIENIQLLLNHGADINKKDLEGTSPIFMIFDQPAWLLNENCVQGFVKYLLEHKARW